MQLGTRWSVGDPLPARLDDAMRAAIASVELERGDAALSWRWTLTWLEGRPVAQLDDGTTVRADRDGSVSIAVEP